MSQEALICFGKTPGYSPVKTRLAKSIGSDKAEAVYRFCIEKIGKLMSDIKSVRPQLETFWAVAEDEALKDPFWQGHKLVKQSSGGLGERLAVMYSEMRHEFDRVTFIGADSPQLTVAHYLQSMTELDRRTEFCFGPTDDGGFYLFSGQTDIPGSIWKQVSYSVDSTLEELTDLLGKLGNCRRISQEFDIDEYPDLLRMTEEMPELRRYL